MASRLPKSTRFLLTFAIFAASLGACRKNVSRSLSDAAVATNTGQTPTVSITPVSCSIITAFPSPWRRNASETLGFVCRHTTGGTLNAPECQADGGSWGACSLPTFHTMSNLAEGAHSFRVRASDTAGNQGMSPLLSWSVDLTSPTIGAASLITATDVTASFLFSATDPNGSGVEKFQCRLPNVYSAWSDCASPKTFNGLAPSTAYTFYVRAFDQAGNASAEGSLAFSTLAVPPGFDGCYFTSAVPPYSRLRTQSFAFACVSPTATISSVECRLDYGAWTNCATQTSHQVTSLSEGDHLFAVRYVDSQAGRSPASTVGWRVNSTLPVAEITSAQTNTLTPAFVFRGRDSAGGSVSNFQCRLTREGATVIDWASCASPLNLSSGVVPEKPHVFSVKVFDLAGNESLPVDYAWTAPATQPPSCVVQTAFGGGFRKNTSETIAFACTSVAPLASYECRMNGQAWSACSGPASHNVSGLQNATSYRFEVRATDSFGNVGSASLPLDWSVDLAAPTAVVDAADAVNTSATLRFTASDTGGSGVASTLCSLDGVSGWTTCASPVAYSGLTVNTTYTFRVKAVDRAGNAGAEATRSFVTTPTYAGPTCSLIAPSAIASGWTNQSNLTFQVSCVGGTPNGLECRLNSGSWSACVSPVVINTSDPGAQSFFVRPIDSNSTPGPVDQANWNFDSTSPDLTLTGSSTGDRSATFTFSATDTGGSGIEKTLCQLSGGSGGWTDCTSPKSYSSLTRGQAYTFSVKARDRAGNESVVRSYSWTVPSGGGGGGSGSPSTPHTALWAQSAQGGYYDATGVIQGAHRLASMRVYGGKFMGGEPVPMYPVLVNSWGHVCFQAGYTNGYFVCSGVPVHYE